MLFDQLSGVAERYLPEFITLLRDAKLFTMTTPLSTDLQSEVGAAWAPDARIIENFRLPFPVTAIECTSQTPGQGAYCVILRQLDAERRELEILVSSLMLDPDSGIADVQYISHFHAQALAGVEDVRDQRLIIPRLALPTGTIRGWHGSKKRGMRSRADCPWFDFPISVMRKDGHTAMYASDELFRFLRADTIAPEDVDTFAHSVALANAQYAVFFVLMINSPSLFVVEERPLDPDQGKRVNPVPRSGSRSRYILLQPGEIRRRFVGPAPDADADTTPGTSRAAHQRRGHFRRLQSERFVHARGQVIWVDAMWIGPSEAVIGKKHYKVRLDL